MLFSKTHRPTGEIFTNIEIVGLLLFLFVFFFVDAVCNPAPSTTLKNDLKEKNWNKESSLVANAYPSTEVGVQCAQNRTVEDGRHLVSTSP